MARKSKTEGNGEEQTNVFADPQKIRDAIETLEIHDEKLKSLKGSYMAECKKVREKIAGVYDAMSDQGVKKRALKAAWNRKKLVDKFENEALNLEEEQQSQLEQIEQALGTFVDTPLGQAAMKAANVVPINGASA